MNLYDYEEPVTKLGVKVPVWIDPDILVSQVAAVLEGGCYSGAYMPAVTYAEAVATMASHGDDVLDYLESVEGLPRIPDDTSWSGIACFFLSLAVEVWCGSVKDELIRALEER